MPLFFFDIETDGRVEIDREGVAVAGPDEARREAVKALQSMASDMANPVRPWRIRSLVRDATDHVVFDAELTLSVH